MRVKHMRNGQPINTSPSKAINIFFNKVGRKLITRGNVQGALEELDDAVDGLKSKLDNKITVKIDNLPTISAQANVVTKIGSITLKKGINRVMFGCEVTPLAVGSTIQLSINTSDEMSGGRALKRIISCNSTAAHDLDVERTFVVNADTPIYFYARTTNATTYYPYYEVYNIN